MLRSDRRACSQTQDALGYVHKNAIHNSIQGRGCLYSTPVAGVAAYIVLSMGLWKSTNVYVSPLQSYGNTNPAGC